MKLVPKTKYGEIEWHKIVEAQSLEAFVKDKNENLHKFLGKPVMRYFLTGSNVIEHVGPNGILIETFHPCETNPFRLI
jgi:hypothetical protein